MTLCLVEKVLKQCIGQKWFKLLFLMGFLCLDSCVQDNPSDNKSGKQHLKEAASYNTQLGLAYLKQGNRPRAKQKLLLAMSQAPNSSDVNAAMAYFLEKSGELNESRKFYQKAIGIDPNSGPQLNNYGAFLCRQGKYNEAESYFLRAIKDSKYEHTAAAYENAGLCAMAIPNEEKAITYFKRALGQDPSQKQSLYQLVTLSIKQRQFDQAWLYLQNYLSPTSRDPVLLNLATDVAHQLGKFEVEASYKVRLKQLQIADNTGEEHDYSDNG